MQAKRDIQTKREKTTNSQEANLALLMRAVIEARNKLSNARDKLRLIEMQFRDSSPKTYQRQRTKALDEYIEASSKARETRTRLLRHLKQRAA